MTFWKTLAQSPYVNSGWHRTVFGKAAIVATLIVATFLVRRMTQWPFMVPQDEGILLVYPDLILRGYVPYSDFTALYSPGGFYFIAGLFRVFGSSIFVERGAGVLYWFLLTAAIFLIGSRVGRATAVLAATTALAYGSQFLSPGAHPHFAAFAFMLLALFFSSGSVTAGAPLANKTHPMLSGFMAGCSGWFKQDIGFVAVIAALGGLNTLALDRLRAFFIGLAIPICGLIVFALFVSPPSFIESLILDPLRNAQRRVAPIEFNMDLVVVAVCCIIQLFGAIVVRTPNIPEHLVRLSRGILTLTVTLYISLLRRLAPGDISFLGVIVVSLTIVSMHITLLHLRVDRRKLAIAMTSGFLAGIVPVGILHLSRSHRSLPPVSWVSSGKRVVPWNGNDSSLPGLIADITTRASRGEKLFVGPRDLRFANHNDTFIYYLLPQLEPVTRYLEMNPDCANRLDSSLAQDIQQADWLILNSEYDPGPDSSWIPGPREPNNVVSTQFCVVAQYGSRTLLTRHACT